MLTLTRVVEITPAEAAHIGGGYVRLAAGMVALTA